MTTDVVVDVRRLFPTSLGAKKHKEYAHKRIVKGVLQRNVPVLRRLRVQRINVSAKKYRPFWSCLRFVAKYIHDQSSLPHWRITTSTRSPTDAPSNNIHTSPVQNGMTNDILAMKVPKLYRRNVSRICKRRIKKEIL